MRWIRVLFIVAGLYDFLLGSAFWLFGLEIFQFFGVTQPNHIGYIQFPSILLVIFGVMFFQVAKDPIANRLLIPYGIALKCAYAGVVFWHDFKTGIPRMWIPWAWADVAFLVLFFIALRQIGASRIKSQ
jgi:hypothetical protein